MDNAEELIEKRERKIFKWLKKYPNYYIALLIVFNLVVRIYYFILTKDQPFWWDESEYMNMAKSIAFNLPYNYMHIRPIAFSFVASLFFRLDLGDILSRVLMLIFSIISLISIYYLGKEMFDEKVGLLSCFLMSVFYFNLFFSYRILMDIPSLAFFTSSIFFFYKYFKYSSIKSLYFAAILISLGYLFKQSTVFILPGILIYLLLTEKLKFLKKKEVWISALIFWLVLSPYLIWAFLTFNSFILTKNLDMMITGGPQVPLFERSLTNFKTYLSLFPTYIFSVNPNPASLYWIFSWILLIFIFLYSMFRLIIGFDLIFKKQETDLKRDLFLLIILLIPLITASYLIGHTEDRYVLNSFPGIFLIISSISFKIHDYLNKQKFKSLGIIFLIVIILFFGYTQLKAADSLTKNKLRSYLEIKQAGLWLKDNSDKSDIIVTKSADQIKYYSDRETVFIPENKEKLDELIKSNPNIKYYVISGYENSGQWSYSYPQENNLTVLQAYFVNQNQPIVIIYRLK